MAVGLLGWASQVVVAVVVVVVWVVLCGRGEFRRVGLSMAISEMLGSGPGGYILGDCGLIFLGLVVWGSSNRWYLLFEFVSGGDGSDGNESWFLSEWKRKPSRIYRQSLNIGQLEAGKPKGTIAPSITMYRFSRHPQTWVGVRNQKSNHRPVLTKWSVFLTISESSEGNLAAYHEYCIGQSNRTRQGSLTWQGSCRFSRTRWILTTDSGNPRALPRTRKLM